MHGKLTIKLSHIGSSFFGFFVGLKKLSQFDAFSVCVAQRHLTKSHSANRAIWTIDILSDGQKIDWPP